MLTSKEVRNTPEPSVYSESYYKQDSAPAEPEIKTWNGRGIFKNETPVTVFSRNDHNIHFNTKLQFCITNESVSGCNPKQQPAIRMDKGNPFIRFFGFKDEEAVDDAISFLNLPKQHKLTEPEDIQSANIGQSFEFEGIGHCYVTPYSHFWFKYDTLAEKIQTLSNSIGSPVCLHVDRHFHTKPITADLEPHEDPPVCRESRLSDTGIGQQPEGVARSCDYLLTTVRHVDKESETGHLSLYLAPRGLGNVDQNAQIISEPKITDDLDDLVALNCLKKPVALKLCRIDDKPGAGYAINQNAEYVFDAQKDSSGNTDLICRNKENPCQELFRGKLSSSRTVQGILTRFVNEGDKNAPPVFKVLHGYEISTIEDLKPVLARPTAADKEEPGIKREILIGRLSVVPKEEELPEFYEKKSTEYRFGDKE